MPCILKQLQLDCHSQLTLHSNSVGMCMPREAALEVLRAAAACVRTTAALKAEVIRVQKILDGSAEGRIKNAIERAAFIAALTAFCPALPADAAMQELAEEIAEFLAHFYKYVLLAHLRYMHTASCDQNVHTLFMLNRLSAVKRLVPDHIEYSP